MVRGLAARVNNRHGACGARPPGTLLRLLSDIDALARSEPHTSVSAVR